MARGPWSSAYSGRYVGPLVDLLGADADEPDGRVLVRRHGGGNGGELHHTVAALHDELDGLAGLLADERRELVPLLQSVPVGGEDLVAHLEAGQLGRALAALDLGDLTDLQGGLGHADRDPHHEQQEKGENEVHGRTGDGHREAARERLLPVGAGLVGGVDLLEVAHPEDADVPADRDGLDPVLGLAAFDGPEAGPEAEEVLADLHPRPLGGDEVAELVQHHDGDEGEDHAEERREPGDERKHEDDSHEVAEPHEAFRIVDLVVLVLLGLAGGLLGQQLCHAFSSLSSPPLAAPALGPAGLHRSQRRLCSALFRRDPPGPPGWCRQSRSIR